MRFDGHLRIGSSYTCYYKMPSAGENLHKTMALVNLNAISKQLHLQFIELEPCFMMAISGFNEGIYVS